MIRRHLATALTCAAAALLPGAPSIAAAPQLDLAPCKIPGLDRAARCGTFDVFEDRAAGRGRKIALRVAMVPASSPPAAGAVFFFNGGPGESAVEAAADVAAEWAAIGRTRDIVLVDVRGTGSSNGLQCAALQKTEGVLGFLESFLPVAGVRTCRAALAEHADLALYTTALAVDDVDDVRRALSYDRIDLAGGSYGSIAALTYLRRHPEHVRTVTIQGVVPPDARLPLRFAADAQAALDLVIAACERETACHAAFPDVAGDIATTLAALEKEPAPVHTRTSSGERVDFRLSRSAAAQSIRYMLYSPVTAAQIPLQAHLAAHGDYSPLAETAFQFGGMATDMSDGYYLSVTCSEDVPFFTPQEAATAAAGTFLGDFRARTQKAACAEWPRGDAADVNAPLHSDAPILMISGERDPVTPPRDAAALAAGLPHAVHVVVPGGGHGMGGLNAGQCLSSIATAFVEKGGEQGLDTSCIAGIPPLPFMTVDPRQPEVAVPAATLDRYVGTYVLPQGAEFVVERHGDHLMVALGEEERHALTPTSQTRFAVNGLPPGFVIEFTLEGERVTGLVLETGPHDRRPAQRKP